MQNGVITGRILDATRRLLDATRRILDATHRILTFALSFHYCQIELCFPSSCIDPPTSLAHCRSRIHMPAIPSSKHGNHMHLLHGFDSGSDSCPCAMHSLVKRLTRVGNVWLSFRLAMPDSVLDSMRFEVITTTFANQPLTRTRDLREIQIQGYSKVEYSLDNPPAAQDRRRHILTPRH